MKKRARSLGVRTGREKEDEEATREMPKREVESPAGCEVPPREVSNEKRERERRGRGRGSSQQ